jgi:hypothetical protein
MSRQILFRAPVKKVKDSNGVSTEAPEMKFVFTLLDKTKAREGTLVHQPIRPENRGRKITLPLSVSVSVTRSIPVSVSWSVITRSTPGAGRESPI